MDLQRESQDGSLAAGFLTHFYGGAGLQRPALHSTLTAKLTADTIDNRRFR